MATISQPPETVDDQRRHSLWQTVAAVTGAIAAVITATAALIAASAAVIQLFL